MTAPRHVRVGPVTLGNDLPVAFFCGPCQIESRAHALEVALHLVESEEGQRRRCHLQALLTQWRDGLDAIEWGRMPLRLMPSSTPIQPLIVGDNAQALAWQDALQAQGCYVGAIRPPTVPPGTARLRVTFSAAHSSHDLQRLLNALQQASRTLSAESASA